MFALIVVVPLVVAAFAAMLMSDNPRPIKYIALAASILSLIIALALFGTSDVSAIDWFSIASYTFSISVSTLPLNMLLLLLVAIMTPLTIAYSMGFMDVPSEQGRYYFEICLFAASMMLFSLAADFLTMLIGWELLGITSYLLIGFWYRRAAAPGAARKAITIVFLGDILMLIAMLVIWNSYHTFSFSLIGSLAQTQSNASVQLAMLLVMIAAFTKSAQFPFHEWLPDAMEGPTPASAFLHSSTMVKAGVFLSVILLPLFASFHLLNVMLIIGMITAIIGACNAFGETQIKRILAYSTIEDLGLMFIALGLNALAAAMTLFLVQTFYKALLFMSAGAIMKANDNEERIDKIRTSAAGKPLLIATLVGVLSMAGIFPLGGFFGKAAIGGSATSTIIYIVLLAISFASSAYIFRWFFLPLRKQASMRQGSGGDFRFIPNSMLLPIYITAALAALASVAYIYLPEYLATYGSAALNITPAGAAIETIAVLLGLVLAYLLYFKSAKNTEVTNRFAYALFNNSVFTNEFYALIAGLFDLIASAIDRADYVLYGSVRSIGKGLNEFAGLLKRLVNGQPNAYIIAFLLGLIAFIIIAIVVP